MDNQNTQTTANGTRNLLSAIVSIFFLLMAGYYLINYVFLADSNESKDAIKAAESYATSQLYQELGVAVNVKSEIIYEDKDDNRLVAVWYRLDGETSWYSAYCVYTKYGSRYNATKMLPLGYDFKENLKELKALFGIVN